MIGEDLVEAVDFIENKLNDNDSIFSGASQLSRLIEQLDINDNKMIIKLIVPISIKAFIKFLKLRYIN